MTDSRRRRSAAPHAPADVDAAAAAAVGGRESRGERTILGILFSAFSRSLCLDHSLAIHCSCLLADRQRQPSPLATRNLALSFSFPQVQCIHSRSLAFAVLSSHSPSRDDRLDLSICLTPSRFLHLSPPTLFPCTHTLAVVSYSKRAVKVEEESERASEICSLSFSFSLSSS